MPLNLHDEVRSNKIKSYFIMLVFFIFVIVLGLVIGLIFNITNNISAFNPISLIFSGSVGLIVAFIYLMIVMSQGPSMILKLTKAKPASRTHYPFLYHTTEALAIAAGMGSTVPKCYVIDDPALNAYATGFTPEKSYIVVTKGLVEKLNRQELEGVLAHEMSHIKNYDIKVMLYAAALVGATVMLSDILFRLFLFGPRSSGGSDKGDRLKVIGIVLAILLVILSPIVAELLRLSLSRRREYLADSSGSVLTRYPEGLASALEKIKNDKNVLKSASKSTAHLFISNPLKKSTLASLFSTHPPIDSRIQRLRGN